MKDIRTSHDILLWLDILKNEGYAFGLNQVWHHIDYQVIQIQKINYLLQLMYGVFTETMRG